MWERNDVDLWQERTIEKMAHGGFEFVLSFPRRREPASKGRGLVVSSDYEVRETLAQSLAECGLAPMFSSTVDESRTAMAGTEVVVVICNEWLPDGYYGDIVNLLAGSCRRLPLVVVSRVGDWPEYLRAVGAGAFDYVAYPPIRGELRRVIRNALSSDTQQLEGADVT